MVCMKCYIGDSVFVMVFNAPVSEIQWDVFNLCRPEPVRYFNPYNSMDTTNIHPYTHAAPQMMPKKSYLEVWTGLSRGKQQFLKNKCLISN